MNKGEFLKEVAEEAQVTKAVATEVFNAVVEVLKRNLSAGQQVKLVGFATFAMKQVAARMGRNPKTGETMTVPAKKLPKISFAQAFKDLLN